ncbi:hypothetical protein [Amycolatopsis sp. DG1A-15b]|uniref:hypothetical protein n=1 Tax=Amycolatopsis sp. DG1A-15b TaxID=3052846 RepID=UPI00255BDD74|nr:hypothetical protein [Amycolatopsis sp. DG1A-15b]WIX88014.1 hypothetical protein QRY02_43950 [Amycolatopsis sp. DG1A-15b]
MNLDELAAVYDALVADYRDLDDGVETFRSAMTAVFEGWTGSAKLACSTYGGQLVDFVNGERDIARDLAAALLAHATILHTARQNWVKLADGLVEAVRKKQHQVDETIQTEVLDRITPYAEHRPTPPPPPLDLPRSRRTPACWSRRTPRPASAVGSTSARRSPGSPAARTSAPGWTPSASGSRRCRSAGRASCGRRRCGPRPG